jgi:hypothetical protein
MLKGWIGVDLDGTLMIYHSGQAPELGEPIPKMVDRVRKWLKQGIDVRIVTARASHPMFTANEKAAIEQWLLTHLGQILVIQCHKDYQMIELWDDRAVQVESNTGERIGKSRLGFS